jgi:hypothetical protein
LFSASFSLSTFGSLSISLISFTTPNLEEVPNFFKRYKSGPDIPVLGWESIDGEGGGNGGWLYWCECIGDGIPSAAAWEGEGEVYVSGSIEEVAAAGITGYWDDPMDRK